MSSKVVFTALWRSPLGQQMVGAGVSQDLHDGPLAAGGVDGDHSPFQEHAVEQAWNGRDLVALDRTWLPVRVGSSRTSCLDPGGFPKAGVGDKDGIVAVSRCLPTASIGSGSAVSGRQKG